MLALICVDIMGIQVNETYFNIKEKEKHFLIR